MTVSRFLWVLLFISTGCAAAALFFWTVPEMLGVSPDSTVYLATATSLVRGEGFMDRGHLMTQYPPGYPLLLAAGGSLNGHDVTGAARWIHALLFSANILLAGALARRVTAGSIVATVGTMAFLLASPAMIAVHTMLWSEPAFIAAILAALLLLTRGLECQARFVVLASAALFASALSVRFAGIVLILVLVPGIVLFWRSSHPGRWRLSAEAGAIFFAPLMLWLARSSPESTVPRYWRLSFHPPGFGHARLLIGTVHDFFFAAPVADLSKAIHLAGLATLCGLVFYKLYRSQYFTPHSPGGPMVYQTLWPVLFVSYVSFILLTIAFVSGETPLDNRILLPALLPVLIGLIGLSHAVSVRVGNRAVRYSAYLGLLLFISVNANRALAEILDIRARGRGFTSNEWISSPTLGQVKQMMSRQLIYTNAPDAVWLSTSRVAIPLPMEAIPDTRRANDRYPAEMKAMCDSVRQGRAVIAYFDAIGWAWFYPTRQEVEAQCQLSPGARYSDGVIYRRSAGGPMGDVD